MKNADMPASPIFSSDAKPCMVRVKGGDKNSSIATAGLTKREHFAGLAMQAYISGTLSWTDGVDGGHSTPSEVEVAQEAVTYADALLAELEK